MHLPGGGAQQLLVHKNILENIDFTDAHTSPLITRLNIHNSYFWFEGLTFYQEIFGIFWDCRFLSDGTNRNT